MDKLRKLSVQEWNGHPEIFSRPQAEEDLGNMLLRTDILIENSRWVPLALRPEGYLNFSFILIMAILVTESHDILILLANPRVTLE